MLQTLGLFADGTVRLLMSANLQSISGPCEVVRVLKTSSSSTIEGALARLVILGTVGSGQVKSWSSSGQKGRSFSKRYHCCSDDKPFGKKEKELLKRTWTPNPLTLPVLILSVNTAAFQ